MVSEQKFMARICDNSDAAVSPSLSHSGSFMFGMISVLAGFVFISLVYIGILNVDWI